MGVGGCAAAQVLSTLDCVAGPTSVRVTGSQATSYKVRHRSPTLHLVGAALGARIGVVLAARALSTDSLGFCASFACVACAQLTAAPVRSGTFVGSLTFKTAEGQYVWYSVEVRASEPPEVAAIDVAAQVRGCRARWAHRWGRTNAVRALHARQARRLQRCAQVRTMVALSVTATNPLDNPVTLTVRYSDPDVLLGPQTVTLPPAAEVCAAAPIVGRATPARPAFLTAVAPRQRAPAGSDAARVLLLAAGRRHGARLHHARQRRGAHLARRTRSHALCAPTETRRCMERNPPPCRLTNAPVAWRAVVFPHAAQLGEFWYQLSMTATEAPPQRLPDAVAQLGTTGKVLAPVANALDRPVKVTATCASDSLAFRCGGAPPHARRRTQHGHRRPASPRTRERVALPLRGCVCRAQRAAVEPGAGSARRRGV